MLPKLAPSSFCTFHKEVTCSGELQLSTTDELMPSLSAASSVMGLKQEPGWRLLVTRLTWELSRSL